MAYDDYFQYRDYVPVAVRRARAAREAARLGKKGQPLSPVVIDGRKIATTFWGEAWCENLERYSDFANRLPRGRTYVRNGSVVDLQITPGVVKAMVSGSDLYRIEVEVAAVPAKHWAAVCTDCAGAVDSVVELLQGRLSQAVMTRLCDRARGLFPAPAEVVFRCSCPDWAAMCKHVAAVLYGIGARLDEQPELLFALRKVDQQELIAQAGQGLSRPGSRPKAGKLLDDGDLAGIFGIEMAEAAEPARPAARRKKASTVELVVPPKPAGPAPKRSAKRQTGLSAAKRAAVSKRMKAYWLARRRDKAKKRR